MAKFISEHNDQYKNCQKELKIKFLKRFKNMLGLGVALHPNPRAHDPSSKEVEGLYYPYSFYFLKKNFDVPHLAPFIYFL